MGPKPMYYDRRNRNPHEMYKKLGGTITAQDITGVLNIDWKKISMPKFRKNFYKVKFKKKMFSLFKKIYRKALQKSAMIK